jgi:Protein of unknown function (DUF3592)
MLQPRLRLPFSAILGLVISFGVELWLVGHAIELSRRNAQAVETTAAVRSEPSYGTAKVARGLFNRRSGYWFDYEFVIDGKTFRGHGMKVDRPSSTATIWYDPADPSQSRTEPERADFGWMLVALGGAACIAAIAKAWSVRGS